MRVETVMAHSFAISPGGKGSNAAVACARQGVRTSLIARIGRDDFGRMSWWQLSVELAQGLTDARRRALFGGNAARIYRL